MQSNQKLVDDIVAVHEKMWIAEWQHHWRQGNYVPYPVYFIRRLDQEVMNRVKTKGRTLSLNLARLPSR